jgi:hypothetical protein
MKLREWEGTEFYKKKYATPVKGRLIVFEEHGTDNHIFMAETWEQVTDAMRAKIIERADDGYYECSETMDIPERPLTDEQIAAAPVKMVKIYKELMETWEAQVEQAEENNHIYDCLQAAINGDRNAAAHFFAMRSDYEDEQFWLDKANDPSAYMIKTKERLSKKNAKSKSC